MATLSFKQELDQIRALHAYAMHQINGAIRRLQAIFRRQISGLKPMGIRSTVYPPNYFRSQWPAAIRTTSSQDQIDDPVADQWQQYRLGRMGDNLDREIQEAEAQIQIELQIKESLTRRKA